MISIDMFLLGFFLSCHHATCQHDSDIPIPHFYNICIEKLGFTGVFIKALNIDCGAEVQWPSGRVSDSGARLRGFDPHSGRRVVSLS